MAKSLDASRKN